MSNTTIPLERRAQLVGVFGLVIQLGLFGVAVWLGAWFDSDAVRALSLHLLGGGLIWVAIVLVFTQRRQSRLEDLETETLKQTQKAGQATHIFDVADEKFLLARRRLAWTQKFILPLITVLLALYHILGPILFWNWTTPLEDESWRRVADPFPPLLFAGGVAFVSFVYARYVIGMSRFRHWRLLRAGGSYLIGNALSAVLLVVAFAVSGSEAAKHWVEPAAVRVIGVGVLLLGIELVVNFILEFYRPRRREEASRPAFDSRLLGLFGEPGGVVRSIAETVNYQFGFEVSGTWVYRLIQRSVFPLTALTALVLILLSSVVIIDVDEEAYIERFGRLVQKESEPLPPGLHFKFPWPVDRTVRTRVDTLRTLTIGELHEAAHGDEHGHGAEEGVDTASHPILWTEEHDFNKEMLTLVASPYSDSVSLEPSGSPEGAQRSRSVSVSLLMISVQVEYEIASAFDFAYRYADPEKVIESIAYQELADYAAGVDATSLMGVERESFTPRMQATLQNRVEEMQLGIHISNVMLQDVHPPSEQDVASTFQNVVAAEIHKSATIEAARGHAERTLTLVAGSASRAHAIDKAIQEMDRLNLMTLTQSGSDAKAGRSVAESRVDDLLFGNAGRWLAPASGAVASVIAGARADRSTRLSDAESKQRQYVADAAAFEASPELFKTRRYLSTFGRILGRVRKVIVTGDSSNVIVEWNSQSKASLDLAAPAVPGSTN
jgi:regulator of protease activity HflC (stomatin/prohibitin superfamily)